MHENLDHTPTVGLVTVATGRYVDFVPPLIASARRHLIGLGPVFVLSDATNLAADGDVRLLPWERMDWPLPTLLRYRAFAKYATELSAVDVLLYTDADMLFVGEVDIRYALGLIAVQHPGYVNTSTDRLPYERRAVSTACVQRGSGAHYFCGGVQGGRSDAYLNAASQIDAGIATDQAAGVMAKWHDESHWNHFLVDHPASTQLSADYCTPDVEQTTDSRILAITKDHAHFRELSGWQRLRWKVRGLRHQCGKALRDGLKLVKGSK